MRLFGNVQATEQNLFFIQSGLSFNAGGSFMVSGQCKGMYSDQPDRPRSVCSGDRLRTFFPFWEPFLCSLPLQVYGCLPFMLALSDAVPAGRS